MGKLVGNLVHSAREWRGAMAVAVLLLDAALTVIIVAKVPYTEIDWIAYMEEVQGFLAGEKNYSLLRGTTGPLVYPGGFVWIYSGLYWLCDEGKDIALAQIIFIFVYLATQAVVLALYTKAKLVPAWALLLLMLSKRVHSIFVLRMFNDSVAALLMYTAILFFVNRRWTLGCVLYSAAVSVKMSALLFAPPLFFLLLCEGGVVGAARRIAICALVQVLAGLPFLLAHPVSYVRGAFDLGRIFMHRWSVNLKFLPEQVFVSRPLAVGLLAAHLLTLGAFFARHLRSRAANIRVWRGTGDLVPEFVCMVLFGGNFIGVVFARTLHFQFYAWYFHTLPALAWATSEGASSLGKGRGVPLWTRVLLLAAVEAAFNLTDSSGCGEQPKGPDCGSPTPQGAVLLTVAHLALLATLLGAPSLDRGASAHASREQAGDFKAQSKRK